MNNSFTIFAGRATVALATSVAVEMGARLGACSVERFRTASCRCDWMSRARPRGLHHSTDLAAGQRSSDRAAGLCRRVPPRLGRAHHGAVIPYFGYARADKRHGRREPITASMVAALMQAVGIDHVVTVDLHAPQIEGFFHIPVDSLTAVPTVMVGAADRITSETVVVSPDAGRVRWPPSTRDC